MPGDDTFHVLSLDGGGIRGVYAAHVLARLEDILESPVRDCFDLIAGTSTGSIIAGAASVGIPMTTLVNLFENQAERIFTKRMFSFFPFWKSLYSTGPLNGLIAEYLPEVTMGEVPTPLMITSSDISTGGVHVFKSRYLEDQGEPYLRDGSVRLTDAIVASCAAPTYFDPKPVGQYLLADGGLWANDPTMLAVCEALSKFQQPLGKIRVLSVGTGQTASFYDNGRRWGLLTGWGGQKLVQYVLGLQSQASTNMARLLLEDRLVRLDPEIGSWGLDDIRTIKNMKALADRDFTHFSKAILKNMGRRPDDKASERLREVYG